MNIFWKKTIVRHMSKGRVVQQAMCTTISNIVWQTVCSSHYVLYIFGSVVSVCKISFHSWVELYEYENVNEMEIWTQSSSGALYYQF